MELKGCKPITTLLGTMAVWCFAAFCLTACHDDDDDDIGSEPASEVDYEVTFINSVNGPGDNGYNDIIMSAEMRFITLFPEVRSRFINTAEYYLQELLYNAALVSGTAGDSVLIVLNGSDFSQLARSNDSISTLNIMTKKHAADMRVLVFEDDGYQLPDRVYAFNIERYGAYYVAGRLLGKMPALVVAGMKGDPQIEGAVQGFIDGYSVENPDGPMVYYLADNVSGFGMPGEAVQLCDSIVESIIPGQLEKAKGEGEDSYDRGLCILPLAGGSNVGMYGYVHNLPENWRVYIIGVDENYNATSYSVPFSIELYLFEILHGYLTKWRWGYEWERSTTFGLSEGIGISLTDYIHPHFLMRFCPDETSTEVINKVLWQKLQELHQEAIEKEEAYMQKKKEERK